MWSTPRCPGFYPSNSHVESFSSMLLRRSSGTLAEDDDCDDLTVNSFTRLCVSSKASRLAVRLQHGELTAEVHSQPLKRPHNGPYVKETGRLTVSWSTPLPVAAYQGVLSNGTPSFNTPNTKGHQRGSSLGTGSLDSLTSGRRWPHPSSKPPRSLKLLRVLRNHSLGVALRPENFFHPELSPDR